MGDLNDSKKSNKELKMVSLNLNETFNSYVIPLEITILK